MTSTDSSLPIWLKHELAQARDKGALVVHAVAMLVASAQLAGNGQLVKPSESDPRVPEWLEGLQARLCGLPRRTATHASDIGPSVGRLAAAIAFKVLQPSLHRSAVSQLPFARSDATALLQGMATALEGLKAASRKANRPSPQIAAERFPQRTPHALMQAAYAVLSSNRLQRHPVQSDVDALALFGLAASALLNMRGCDFCFRLAMAGHRRCSEHSLSKEAGGDPLGRQARYQSARRAVSEYRARLKELPVHFNVIKSLKQRSLLISAILWGAPVPDEGRITSSVAELVIKYPHVREMLECDAGTRPSQLFDDLRRVLDPLEFVVGNWRTKLRAAEAWFQAVESSTPGVRRSGTKGHLTKLYALDLVQGVDLSKSELAAVLEVHPSTLSKWFARNGDDPVVVEILRYLADSAPRVLKREERKKRLMARMSSRPATSVSRR